MEKENFDRENQAAIEKFRKVRELAENQGDQAERLLKNFLKKGLGEAGSDQRKALAKDLIRASKDSPPSEFRGGEFGSRLKGVDDSVLTGYEPRPWDEDDE